MKSKALELRLPPDVAYVSLARSVVCAAARHAGMDDDRVEDLRIAVSEATTNAIAAHEQSGSEQPVVLSFGPAGDASFEVTILDTGPGFDPISPAAAAERDWTEENGLGVTLIRALTDEVKFVRGGGMRVNMRFAIGLDGDRGG